MKRTLFAALALLFAACMSCSHAPIRTAESQAVEDLMDSTVQVHVTVKGTMTTHVKGKAVEQPYQAGWMGSGAVIAKEGGLVQPEQSTILTANHVLDAPEPGTKIAGPNGDSLVVDEVEMTITTYRGRTCELTPVAMGQTDQRDVATAYANCDAGRVAEISDRVPPPGAHILVTGHPDGMPLVIVTDGYVSGWQNKYLVVSAPIYPGNSGGPLWYEGKIVGVMVRVDDYMHIALSVSLGMIHERVNDTP